MQTILPIFQAVGGPPGDHDPLLINHMKKKKVSHVELKALIEKAITAATKFAALHVKKSKHETK